MLDSSKHDTDVVALTIIFNEPVCSLPNHIFGVVNYEAQNSTDRRAPFSN
jgi:hypothetical protein